MRVRLTSRAYRDLTNIATHIEADNPTAAQRVMQRIDHSLSLLSAMPQIGRPSGRPGTRELPVGRFPLLIVYRVGADAIEVLTIFHTSRNPDEK